MKDKKKVIGIIAIVVAILAIIATIGMYCYRNAQETKGRIELTVIDQDDYPADQAAKFNFKQVFSEENKQEIAEATLGPDGVIDFYDVPEGKYELEIIDIKDGYSFSEDNRVLQFDVEANKTTKLTWHCTRKGGAFEVTLVDTEEKSISEAVVNVYDKEGEYMCSITTNDQGKGLCFFEEDAVYYFQLDKDCEKAKEYNFDTTLYKFEIDQENRSFKTTVVNEKKATENE